VNTQKLQQSPQSLVIQEGDELTINCNSSESLYTLHWYWQGNDGGPIFLVTLQKGGDRKSNDKITAKLDEKMQQSSLHIRASQPRHSGTYLCGTVHSGEFLETGNPFRKELLAAEMLPECLLAILWMQLTVVNGQVLSQSAQYVSIPEGKDASMSCNSSSALDNVLWYKQDPKEGLVLLVALYKSGEVARSGKVTAEFGGTRKDSVLTLSVSEPADTSTYFCAGEHSDSPGTRSLNQICSCDCSLDTASCSAPSICYHRAKLDNKKAWSQTEATDPVHHYTAQAR
ncbi:hypothetical protein U0070_013462, partial [Myodes glareolus]